MLKGMVPRLIITVTVLVILMVPMVFVSAANTVYYVDATLGSDSNSGTSTSSAWRTLAKINATTFEPGDKILFKAGCSWVGQLYPKGSGANGNPVIIDMYGTGNKPKKVGLTFMTGYD